MGQTSSTPAVAAQPKVRIDSPTTIESSSGFHLLELHGPTISAMFLYGLATLSTASLALFIYRAVSKRRRQKEAKIGEEARKENITFQSQQPRTTGYGGHGDPGLGVEDVELDNATSGGPPYNMGLTMSAPTTTTKKAKSMFRS